MLTLDEAIQHCKEQAAALRMASDYGCDECAAEHEQLAEWLTELKQCREAETVKRGTWKYGYNPDVGILCYFCSACGKEAYWDTDYGQQRFDF